MKNVVSFHAHQGTLRSIHNDREYEYVEWRLMLECDHEEIRRVRYVESARRNNMRRERNAYPPPKRVKCRVCEKGK